MLAEIPERCRFVNNLYRPVPIRQSDLALYCVPRCKATLLHVFFLPFFNMISVTSCLLPWAKNSFQNEVTLKGKNLLLQEQVLSFKSYPHKEWRQKCKRHSSFTRKFTCSPNWSRKLMTLSTHLTVSEN